MRKGPLLQPRPIVIPAKAGIQYAAACRLIIGSSAILDRPPSRAMTEWGSRVSAFSRRECVRVVREFSAFHWEGRGECRAPTHPQPRMQSKKAYELVTTGKAGVPGIPARDGFNGFLRDLPGDRLCCHRRFACAKLDASVEASGPHDFAVRVQHRSSAVLTIASIASRPASVTIASAPRWDETAQLGKCFASGEKRNIFGSGTGQAETG